MKIKEVLANYYQPQSLHEKPLCVNSFFSSAVKKYKSGSDSFPGQLIIQMLYQSIC